MITAIRRGDDLPEVEKNPAVGLLVATFYGYVSLDQAGGFNHSSPGSQHSWSRALDTLDTLLRRWPKE